MSKHPENVLLFKYGGNAMTDESLKHQILERICALKKDGCHVVIVHGGGPFIKRALADARIESEFIDGHRKTTKEALRHVEMALKGEVNSGLVSLINTMGFKAVGLSGKDGKSVTAVKRIHKKIVKGTEQEYDLGQVGDVLSIDTSLIEKLLESDYIPVMTCLADDPQGLTYNINADMFAGHLAGALRASQYIVMTDVDGLRRDKDDPETLMSNLKTTDMNDLISQGVIQGGMIPKIESCVIALEKGAAGARIINGTKPEQIKALIGHEQIGTLIQP